MQSRKKKVFLLWPLAVALNWVHFGGYPGIVFSFDVIYVDISFTQLSTCENYSTILHKFSSCFKKIVSKYSRHCFNDRSLILSIQQCFQYGNSTRNGLAMDLNQIQLALRCCGRFQAIKHAKSLHSLIIKLCLFNHVFLLNNIISVYAKCSHFNDARTLFDDMPQRNIIF